MNGLVIAYYGGGSDQGFYLFGCDAEWNTVTDTWHESVIAAKRQAEHEYEGTLNTWIEHPIATEPQPTSTDNLGVAPE